MDTHLNLKSELITQIRIKVLHKLITDLVQGLGILDPSDMEIIRKSILIKQILETLQIFYLDTNGRVVDKARITLEWVDYQVIVQISNGLEFKIDSKHSIKEQISEVYSLLN